MEKRTEVVAALAVREGRFLICKRPKNKARGGLWEFVGGKVEEGETGEQALDRECREELGVGAETHGVYLTVEHNYPDLLIRLTLYRATLKGEPQLLEHEALAWITPSEIDGYAFCPADQVILEQLKRGLL